MKSQGWNVYAIESRTVTVIDAWGVRRVVGGHRRRKLIDTVWFDVDMDADTVCRSLIDHDGYPGDIEVRKGR